MWHFIWANHRQPRKEWENIEQGVMADMAGDVDWDESSNQSTSELVGQRITVKQVGPG